MDYDDDFADRAQVAGEVGENLTLANALGVQLRLVEKALGTHGRRHLWHVRSLHGTNRGRTPQHPAHDKSLHRPRLTCGSAGLGCSSSSRLLCRANADSHFLLIGLPGVVADDGQSRILPAVEAGFDVRDTR